MCYGSGNNTVRAGEIATSSQTTNFNHKINVEHKEEQSAWHGGAQGRGSQEPGGDGQEEG